jgi:hypothetical protein
MIFLVEVYNNTLCSRLDQLSVLEGSDLCALINEVERAEALRYFYRGILQVFRRNAGVIQKQTNKFGVCDPT